MIDQTKLAGDLEQDEGSRLRVYRCSQGFLTIGIGHNLEAGPVTLDGVTFDASTTVITPDQQRALFAHDMDRVLVALDARWPWWRDLPEPWQRALANMAFQMGINGLSKFRAMWAALKQRDGTGAHREALRSRWARQTPNRAARVAALFLEEEQSNA